MREYFLFYEQINYIRVDEPASRENGLSRRFHDCLLDKKNLQHHGVSIAVIIAEASPVEKNPKKPAAF